MYDNDTPIRYCDDIVKEGWRIVDLKLLEKNINLFIINNKIYFPESISINSLNPSNSSLVIPYNSATAKSISSSTFLSSSFASIFLQSSGLLLEYIHFANS